MGAPKILEDRTGKRISVFDRHSNKSLRVVKAVDIVELCPARLESRNSAVRLEYTEDTRGGLCVFRDDLPLKYRISPFMVCLDEVGVKEIEFLERAAEELGLTLGALTALILENAPPLTGEPAILVVPTVIGFHTKVADHGPDINHFAMVICGVCGTHAKDEEDLAKTPCNPRCTNCQNLRHSHAKRPAVPSGGDVFDRLHVCPNDNNRWWQFNNHYHLWKQVTSEAEWESVCHPTTDSWDES